MMISILALLILVGGAAVLGLIIYAIFNKKFWIIPAAGAVVFLGLMACGLFRARVEVTAPIQVAQQVNGMVHTLVQGPPNFNAYISAPSWTRILLIAFVLGLIVRRWMSRGAGHGLRRGWPAIAVILFIAVMLLGSIRSDYRVSNAATEMAARQQIVIANQSAHIASQVSQQLAQSDIQDIEQFDAPRIPIRPDVTLAEAPKAPAAPAAPAQPAVAKPTDKSPVKPDKDDAKKPAAAPNHKRKKSDATTASNDNKQAQPVAQSKPTEETSAKKETASTSDKPATAAEAKPEKSTSRPAWIDEPPKRTGNTRREVISTEDYATIEECYQAVDVYLLLKTYERMQQLAGQPFTDGQLPSLTFRNGQIIADGQIISHGGGNPEWADYRLYSLRNMGIDIDYVRREIVAKDPKNNESREFVESVERSVGPMKKLFLQIEFTPAIDRELRRHWDARARTERFATVGVGAGSILGLLGLIFGLLKIDTWTKGYYTKRLFIGVPAAIIAGFLLLVILGTHAIYR